MRHSNKQTEQDKRVLSVGLGWGGGRGSQAFYFEHFLRLGMCPASDRAGDAKRDEMLFSLFRHPQPSEVSGIRNKGAVMQTTPALCTPLLPKKKNTPVIIEV